MGQNFEALRNRLWPHITPGMLQWNTISLASGFTIDVSFIPYIQDIGNGGTNQYYFVPVTAKETWTFAEQNKAFPLTRAVADQAFNHAFDHGKLHVFFGNQQKLQDLMDFEQFTNKLKGTAFFTAYGQPAFGAFKLWVMSSWRYPPPRNPDDPIPNPRSDPTKRAVNYGGYLAGDRSPKQQQTMAPRGKYLMPHVYAEQELGTEHWGLYWDYSQHLALMRNLVKDKSTAVDLRKALTDPSNAAHPAVWDEVPDGIFLHPRPLTDDELPSSPGLYSA